MNGQIESIAVSLQAVKRGHGPSISDDADAMQGRGRACNTVQVCTG
jgi:hypothetical protein